MGGGLRGYTGFSLKYSEIKVEKGKAAAAGVRLRVGKGELAREARIKCVSGHSGASASSALHRRNSM